MRGTVIIFYFIAIILVQWVQWASGKGGGGGGGGGHGGGGGGGHGGGATGGGGRGSTGGGRGSGAGGKSGGSGVIGAVIAGIAGAAAGAAIASSMYHYNPTYYGYYHFYHGYHSDEDYGPSEPQLPAATAQDKADATNIVNARFSEKVIASILPFREQLNRQVINSEIANYNKGKRLIHPMFKPNHKKNPVFKDLCFGLVNDPITVLTMYLGEFLHRRDETFIIIVLTLCQEMSAMHFIYNHRHENGLTTRRKKQRHPFSNLMRVWVANDRDAEDTAFTTDDVKNKAESLEKEYPHWKETRDELENTLIRRSLKFGLAVIEKFQDDLKISIEEAIKQKIKNHDLVDAYTSLAQYVNDRFNYMATIMLKHSDGTDRWAVWIMMIAITTRDDWPKIDDAFKKINNGISLKDHILKTTEADRIPFEMMAVMIDPKYKPSYL